jgi:hypothetical protein
MSSVKNKQFILNITLRHDPKLLKGNAASSSSNPPRRVPYTGESKQAKTRAEHGFEKLLEIWMKDGMGKDLARAINEADEDLTRCKALGIESLVREAVQNTSSRSVQQKGHTSAFKLREVEPEYIQFDSHVGTG